MERVLAIWNASLLGRFLSAVCRWVGRQWRDSGVIGAFLSPMAGEERSRSSIFFRLWQAVRGFLTRIYEALRLDRLFAGSIFLQCWLWCALAVVIAPLAPTMAVLALALVGFGSLGLKLLRRPDRELAFAPVNRFVALYAAVYLAGTLCSVNLRSSLYPGFLTVVFVLFALVLYNAVEFRAQLDALVTGMVLAAAAVSFYGLLQYLFGWGYQSSAWVDSDMFSSIGFRVTSTLQNPNMLGQYLLLTIPLGGAKLLSAKTMGRRIFYFCCCGLLCFCMLLTFARGAWLGLLCAGGAFFVLLAPRLILLLPAAAAGLYFVLPQTVVSRFASIGNLADHSTSYRLYIWLGTLDMLRDGYWLCGIGPGEEAFNQIYPAYGYNAVTAPHSHNLFLQIMCDAGVCALAVFLILLFQYFRTLCVALKRERDWTGRCLQIAFLSGMGGFLVQAMTDYSFYNYRVMFLFWAYLALGSLAARRGSLPEGGLLE